MKVNTVNNVCPLIHRAKVFNNAGARCFYSGKMQIAWDLFKAALDEYKISQAPPGSLSNPSELRTPYIERAETHLSNLEAILRTPSSNHNDGDHANESGSSVASTTTSNPENERRSPGGVGGAMLELQGARPYDPFVVSTPILVDEATTDAGDLSTPSLRMTGAAIIYNLGLLEQLRTRSARQVMCLYQLASSLIGGSQSSGRLGVALINNIAVWCFENGDLASAQRCMEHLQRIFDEESQASFNKTEIVGMMTNISYILTPHFFASPAA